MNKIKLLFYIIVFIPFLTACVGESIDKTTNLNLEAINNIIREKPSSLIPSNCISWFDGCNNCLVIDGKINSCTEIFCPEENIKEPYCLKTKEDISLSKNEELILEIGPEKIACEGEKIIECLVVNGELFYNEIENFYFEPGYNYQISATKTSSDTSSTKYKLIDILSKTEIE